MGHSTHVCCPGRPDGTDTRLLRQAGSLSRLERIGGIIWSMTRSVWGGGTCGHQGKEITHPLSGRAETLCWGLNPACMAVFDGHASFGQEGHGVRLLRKRQRTCGFPFLFACVRRASEPGKRPWKPVSACTRILQESCASSRILLSCVNVTCCFVWRVFFCLSYDWQCERCRGPGVGGVSALPGERTCRDCLPARLWYHHGNSPGARWSEVSSRHP